MQSLNTARHSIPNTPSTPSTRTILLLPAFFALMAVALAGVLVGVARHPAVPARALAAQTLPASLSLTILAQKPGSTLDGPAYSNTHIVLPAHTRVTITIVNQDPGDTDMPATSPFLAVHGTVGNTALVDGVPYSALPAAKVAHTFTVPGLGLNVPIPGDVPSGQKDITVTFTILTGSAGSYMFQCMDPCGSGASGWEGPMATMGYMMGQVTIR